MRNLLFLVLITSSVFVKAQIFPYVVNDKAGFLNANGDTLSQAIFKEYRVFGPNGAYLAKYERQWWLLDSFARPGYGFYFEDLICLSGNNALIRKNNFFGIINDFGKEVEPLLNRYLDEKENYYFLRTEYSSVALGKAYNKKLKYLLTNHPENILSWMNQYVLIAKSDSLNPEKKLWGIIDTSGKIIISQKYEKLIPHYSSKTFGAKKNKVSNLQDNLWGVLDFEENVLVPFIYTDMEVSEGGKPMFAAKNNQNHWGILNATNEIVFPFSFDHINALNDEVILAGTFSTSASLKLQPKLKFDVYNFFGNKITSGNFDDLSFNSVNQKINFFYKQKKKVLVGLLNEKGEQLVPCRYESIEEEVVPNFFIVYNHEFDKGLVDAVTGSEVFACKFDEIFMPTKGFDSIVGKEIFWPYLVANQSSSYTSVIKDLKGNLMVETKNNLLSQIVTNNLFVFESSKKRDYNFNMYKLGFGFINKLKFHEFVAYPPNNIIEFWLDSKKGVLKYTYDLEGNLISIIPD